MPTVKLGFGGLVSVWLVACNPGAPVTAAAPHGSGGTDGGAASAACVGVAAVTLEELFPGELVGCSISSCHGPGAGGAAPISGLLFTDEESFWRAVVGQPSTEVTSLDRVTPGDPNHSYLYQKLAGTASVGLRMPMVGPVFDSAGLAQVAGWICAGAPGPLGGESDGGLGMDGGTSDAGLADGGTSDAGLQDAGAAVDSGPAENPAPVLASIAPGSVTAGASTDLTISLSGSGFLANSQVEIDFSPVSASYQSATSLSATVPAAVLAVGGSHAIEVVNPAPGGGTSAPVTLLVSNPTPTTTQLSPNPVSVGGAPFTLSITGSGFDPASTVLFNGGQLSASLASATLLSVQIPSIAAAGSYPVTVTNPTPGGGSATIDLTAQSSSAPSITGLSPTQGAAGLAFSLTVSGSGYVCGSSQSEILFNGSALTTTSCGTTQLMGSVPAMAAGTYPVKVSNPAGGQSSNTVDYILAAQNPVPTLASLTPASAIAGSSAFTLTATGSAFVSGATLSWNGSPRTTSFGSSTAVTAQLLASDVQLAGSYPVIVTNPSPGGGPSNAIDFAVTAAPGVPSIGSLSPSSGLAGSSAFTLTVNGGGFVGSSTVAWNGSARTTTYVSATQLSASILASDVVASGTDQVTVVTPPPGGGTSNAASFTVTAPAPTPTLAALSPCGVIAGSGSFTLTLDGSGFQSGATVTFNGSPLGSASFISSTQLTVTVPGSAIAVAPSGDATNVTVSNLGGSASNAVTLGVASQSVSFSGAVQPIFTSLCIGCHYTGNRIGAPMSLQSGLSYGNLVGVTSSYCSPELRVLGCGPLTSQSVLIDKLFASTPCYGLKMPPSGSITNSQQQTILDWVAEGAPNS